MENKISILFFMMAMVYFSHHAIKTTRNIYSLIRIHLDIRLYKKQREALK
jgi:hypothetical protein